MENNRIFIFLTRTIKLATHLIPSRHSYATGKSMSSIAATPILVVVLVSTVCRMKSHWVYPTHTTLYFPLVYHSLKSHEASLKIR
jgi:hypothetical protein